MRFDHNTSVPCRLRLQVALAAADLPGGPGGSAGTSGGGASPAPGDGPTTVPCRLASELSYSGFCLEYMEAGQPVIIQVRGGGAASQLRS